MSFTWETKRWSFFQMFCVPARTLGGFPMKDTCSSLSTARPEVFGPVTWYSLHILAQQYPDRPDPSRIQACTGFVASLPYMLPEASSAAFFQRYTIDYPGSLQGICAGGAQFRQFFCNAHNAVNESLGKQPFSCDPVTLAEHYATAPICAPSP